MMTFVGRISQERLVLLDNVVVYLKDREDISTMYPPYEAEFTKKTAVPLMERHWFKVTYNKYPSFDALTETYLNYQKKMNQKPMEEDWLSGDTKHGIEDGSVDIDDDQDIERQNQMATLALEQVGGNDNVTAFREAWNQLHGNESYSTSPWGFHMTQEEFIEAKKKEFHQFEEAMLIRKTDAALRKDLNAWKTLEGQERLARYQYQEWLKEVEGRQLRLGE